MNRTLKQYDGDFDDAKSLLIDAREDIEEMVDAMSKIFNICGNADEENWRDCIIHIQSIAEDHS